MEIGDSDIFEVRGSVRSETARKAAIEEKKQQFRAFVNERLKYRIGKGQIFGDQESYVRTLSQLYQKFKALNSTLNPDLQKEDIPILGVDEQIFLTPRQALIAGVVLGLDGDELKKFRDDAAEIFNFGITMKGIKCFPLPDTCPDEQLMGFQSFDAQKVKESLREFVAAPSTFAPAQAPAAVVTPPTEPAMQASTPAKAAPEDSPAQGKLREKIKAILASRVGDGKAFPTQDIFELTLRDLYHKFQALDSTHGEYRGQPPTLGDDDPLSLTPRQALVAGVVLGLGGEELQEFQRDVAEITKASQSTSAAALYPPPNKKENGFTTFRVVDVQRALKDKIKPVAAPVRQKPTAITPVINVAVPPAAEPPPPALVSVDVVAAAEAGKPAVAALKPIAATLPEATPRQDVVKRVAPPDKAPHGASVITFPDGKKGDELLAYAREKGWRFGKLLEEVRLSSGYSESAFARELGLGEYGRHHYKTLINPGATLTPNIPAMNNLAVKLGAAPEGDNTGWDVNKREWYRYITNVPAEMNQSALEHCLDDGNSQGIDTKTYGFAHTVALAKFFKVLGNSHGLLTRSDLVNAIIKNANADDPGALFKRLQAAINNMAGPKENASIDVATLTPEQLASQANRAKGMPDYMAGMVARFAFPDKSELRQKLLDFLDAEKHRIPEDVESKNKSAVMRALRQQRGDNWGRRGSTGQGSPVGR